MNALPKKSYKATISMYLDLRGCDRGERTDIQSVLRTASRECGLGHETPQVPQLVLKELSLVLTEFKEIAKVGFSANKCYIISLSVPSKRMFTRRWLRCNQQVKIDKSEVHGNWNRRCAAASLPLCPPHPILDASLSNAYFRLWSPSTNETHR